MTTRLTQDASPEPLHNVTPIRNKERRVVRLAGNASVERERKVQAYETAKSSGVKGQDLAILKASAQAARATELSETGGNDQAGYLK